jgi:hypothetical protein
MINFILHDLMYGGARFFLRLKLRSEYLLNCFVNVIGEASNRLHTSVDYTAARNESDSTAFDVVERRVNRSAQLTKVTPSLCTNRPGKNYVSVIGMMARDVAFLGRASGSARRTSVVNTSAG